MVTGSADRMDGLQSLPQPLCRQEIVTSLNLTGPSLSRDTSGSTLVSRIVSVTDELICLFGSRERGRGRVMTGVETGTYEKG